MFVHGCSHHVWHKRKPIVFVSFSVSNASVEIVFNRCLLLQAPPPFRKKRMGNLPTSFSPPLENMQLSPLRIPKKASGQERKYATLMICRFPAIYASSYNNLNRLCLKGYVEAPQALQILWEPLLILLNTLSSSWQLFCSTHKPNMTLLHIIKRTV